MKRFASALIMTLGVGCLSPLPALAADYLLYTPEEVQAEPAPPPAGDGVLVKRLTIRKGDTLSHISRKENGRASYYSQILLFNRIPNPDLIYAGDTILVPVMATKGGKRVREAVRSGHALGAPEKAAPAAPTPAPAARPALKPVTATPKVSSARVSGEQALYAKAVGEYKSGRYQAAAASFTRFLEQYPDSALAPDAALYKAESLDNLSK